MIPGKIIIKNKVYFEPDGLEKPDGMDYEFNRQGKRQYFKAVRDYEASKQLIEVENVWKPLVGIKSESVDYFLTNKNYIPKLHNELKLKNNQNCKAEIKGECAIIISLTKE
jgi:hypothetical protein